MNAPTSPIFAPAARSKASLRAERFILSTSRALMRLPSPLRKLIARKPIVIEGRTLDAETQLLVAASSILPARDPRHTPVDRVRKDFVVQTAAIGPERSPAVKSEDRIALHDGARVPVRIYRREGVKSPAPAVVYYHGGGFVMGDLDSHDLVCAHLAARASVTVISVDYRLAPEHPFPAPVEDALTAYRWVLESTELLRIDPSRIAVAGDSAGGNLSAVVCQEAKRLGFPMPRTQLLLYPATDMRRLTASHRTFAEGFLLTKDTIDWFIDSYVPRSEDWVNPLASPLLAEDVSNLAPAVVVAVGFDPLRDEGKSYADRLEAAGVPVTYQPVPSLVHGFVSFAGVVKAAQTAYDASIDALMNYM